MGADADFDAIAARYREAVAAYHGHLRTIGLPPETVRERDSRADLRLQDLFIPLRLVSEQGRATPEDLARVLDRRGSTVVLGDPGSGKSTLLAYLALLFAGGATLEGFSPPRGTIPLFISLRDLVRTQREAPELSFVAYLEAHASKHLQVSAADQGFFATALGAGEAVVLLDGLDEVGSEAARHRVAASIRAFHAQFPECRLWITSRIYGYTSSVRLPGEAFAHYRVGRLDDAQVNGFIERWYAVQIPNDPADRAARSAALREAVHRTPSVRRLASNPLLLTLMAFIHHGLRKLPQDRGELYEKCVEMLLKTWQEARRESDAAAHDVADLKLHVQTQKDYLAHLALFAQETARAKKRAAKDEEARGLLSRGEALDCLEARHFAEAERRRPGLTRAQAREEMRRFLAYVSDETGLLIDRGGDQLSFIHLSFQEYLAAWVFTCGPSTPQGSAFFEQHIGDPAWEEVLLLRLYILLRAPGGGGTAAFDTVVGALLRKLEAGGSPEAWMTLTRALRDDLDFRPSDQQQILRRALGFWLEAPELSGTWFTALEDVRLFAERARETLRGVLAEARAREPVARALAALHLEERLFGFPADAAERLRERPDLSAMLPDLVAFEDEPTIGALLAERAAFADWSKALRAFDRPALYRRTLRWTAAPAARAAVDAAIGQLWGKSLEELRSRAAFATPRRGSDAASLFERPGSVIAEAPRSSAALPLVAFRALGVEPPGGEARREIEALCLGLAQRRLAGRDEQLAHAELSAWMATLIAAQMAGCVAGTSAEPGLLVEIAAEADRDFGLGFLRDFVRDFVRAFGRAFVRAFGRDFGRGFVRDFVRDLVRGFVRDFVRDLVRDFGRDFGRDFVRAFGRDFGRDFVRAFIRDFGRDFVRAFGPDVGVDQTQAGWEDAWEQAIGDETRLLRLLQDDHFWWFVSYQSSLKKSIWIARRRASTWCFKIRSRSPSS